MFVESRIFEFSDSKTVREMSDVVSWIVDRLERDGALFTIESVMDCERGVLFEQSTSVIFVQIQQPVFVTEEVARVVDGFEGDTWSNRRTVFRDVLFLFF